MEDHEKTVILVVDDDEASRYATARIVRSAGFEVVEAASGREALERAKNVDLIVLDLNLPDISGFEVRKRLRSDPATESILVLHLTATYRSIKDKVAGLEGGADGYLTSPVEPEELLASIRALLRLRKAEQEMEREARQWNATFDAISDAISLLDTDAKVLRFNRAFREQAGGNAEQISGRFCHELIHGTHTCIEGCPFLKARETGKRATADLKCGAQWLSVTVDPVRDANGRVINFVHVMRDITEQRLMEDRLRQAQKMETVGQLAGGVAHNFNNMLQVIISYAEMSLAKVDTGQPLYKYLLEIRRAAQRSAEITAQLLAFARRQAVSPKVLGLNDAVANTQKMIQRLIGEDIDLTWMLGHDLWKVKIDPEQLDQILANLAVNARDAIGGVGKLTIEMENVTFDEAYCAAHAGFVPGEYVLLAMSDDGCGMDKETLSHLFEPFFTTKGQGKGTGLGLATIYGIVKQNNGFINVYSEPGHGSTFKVYLPRAQGATAAERLEAEAPAPRGGDRDGACGRG